MEATCRVCHGIFVDADEMAQVQQILKRNDKYEHSAGKLAGQFLEHIRPYEKNNHGYRADLPNGDVILVEFMRPPYTTEDAVFNLMRETQGDQE